VDLFPMVMKVLKLLKLNKTTPRRGNDMNRTEQFEQRRKYRTTEDLANQLEVWEERLRKKEGSFTMCIPPDINDTDIVIDDAVNRLRKLQKENEEMGKLWIIL